MKTEARLPPAYRLVRLDSVDSTNEEAKRLAREGAEDGTLVWAREQTRGRGRRGRHWASPAGNLYLSLVLRPECSVQQAAQLAFVAALGVGDALGSLVPPLVELRFKWPNDVLLNERKVAGILLESSLSEAGGLDWIVLGLGVNVTSHPTGAEFPATDLAMEGSPDVTAEQVLEAFSRHFLSWVNRWLDEGFAPVRSMWLRRALGMGEAVRVRLDQETLEGRFIDLDENGALILGLPEGGQRRVAAGDVFYPSLLRQK